MRQASRFWDRHAVRYSKRKIDNEEAYRKKLAMTQAMLKDNMTVLELGCGTGTTAIHHAPFVREIHAVDYSLEMLEIAVRKAKEKGIDNIRFRQRSIDDLAVEESRYDVIMAHSVLHLLKDWKGAIGKIHCLLKPGGVFVSSTACLKGIMPWLKVVLPVGNFFGLLPKVYFLSEEELEEALKTSSFDIETMWQPGEKQAHFIIARKAA